MRMKHLLLSLLATVAGLLAWQHIEGLGLGAPHHRGLTGPHVPGEDSLHG